MKREVFRHTLSCAGIVAAGSASPCAAQQIDFRLPAKAEPAEKSARAAQRSAAFHPADFDRGQNAGYGGALDWGTGALRIGFRRAKSGSKYSVLPVIQQQWRRSFTGRITASQDISAHLAGRAGMKIGRTKSGALGAPLLTKRSVEWNREAFVSIAADDHAMLTLSLFDNGGWTTADLADFANRTANGEARARKGASLELALPGPRADWEQGDDARFALRLERSNTPALGLESTAQLVVGFQF
mgnify:CR=1 FL=1